MLFLLGKPQGLTPPPLEPSGQKNFFCGFPYTKSVVEMTPQDGLLPNKQVM